MTEALNRWLRVNGGLAALLGAYLLLAVLYNLANPPFEAPDELFHYDFVYRLRQDARLPAVDVEGPLSQYHQPPLYYTAAALWSLPFPLDPPTQFDEMNPFWGYDIGRVGADNKIQYIHDPALVPLSQGRAALHWLRLFSAVLGAGAVYFTYRLALTLRLNPAEALAAAAVMAFTPNYLLISGAVTNDSLVVLIAAAACLLLCRLAAMPSAPHVGHWAALAALLAAAALTKLNVWPLMPLAALATALLALRLRSVAVFVTGGVILLGGVMLLAGWWPLRNFNLYGDFTGFTMMAAVWTPRGQLTTAEYLIELRNMRGTFWANFGYGNVPLAGWVYAAMDAVLLSGLAGLLWSARRALQPERAAQATLLAVFLVMVFAGLMLSVPSSIAVTGRHLYPALPIIAVGIAAGWGRLFGRRGLAALTAGMGVLAVGAFTLILVPVYRAAPTLSSLQQAEMQPLGWQMGEGITLLGYSLDQPSISPGGRAEVTLYWRTDQPLEAQYTTFVHLIDAQGEIIGKRDTYPDMGRRATTTWPPGAIIVDARQVPVPPTAEGPVLLRIEAGLYDQATGERLPIRDPAGSTLAFPIIGQIKLGQADPLPVPSRAARVEQGRFSEPLRLQAFTYEASSVELTLYWAAEGTPSQDYVVFVHLLDAEGNLLAQADGPPVGGHYPFSAWEADEHIIDTRKFTAPPTEAGRAVNIRIGLYDPASGMRLPLQSGADSLLLPLDER